MSRSTKERSGLPISERLSRLLFPPTCIGCGELLPTFDAPDPVFCPTCKALSEAALCEDSVTLFDGGIPCLGHINLYNYRTGKKDGVPEKLIYHLKYRGERRVTDYVSLMLGRTVLTVWPVLALDRDLSTVVWTYPPRRRTALCRYGFDQSKRLAQALADTCGGECLPVLARTKAHVREQKHLTAADRHRNMAHAYALTPRVAGQVSGRPVILVDDVRTTGATLAACTSLLTKAGASSVMWVTVAKTPKYFGA